MVQRLKMKTICLKPFLILKSLNFNFSQDSSESATEIKPSISLMLNNFSRGPESLSYCQTCQTCTNTVFSSSQSIIFTSLEICWLYKFWIWKFAKLYKTHSHKETKNIYCFAKIYKSLSKTDLLKLWFIADDWF